MSRTFAVARRLVMSRYLSSTAVSKPSASSKIVDAIRHEEDTPTHTGQHWNKDDARLARFVNKTKLVTKQHAIDLVDEIEPIACTDRVVSCNGGGGPLGHPKVFINLDRPGNHTCGYCGLRFYLDHDKAHH